MEPGQIVEAVVAEIRDFGLFLEAQGERILILLPELSWLRVRDPRELATEGDLLEVLLLHRIESYGYFAGSLKKLRPQDDPWAEPHRFALGACFDGEVAYLADYGCFVRINRHVAGLLHNHRGGASRQVGEMLEVRIIASDIELQRIEFELVSPAEAS